MLILQYRNKCKHFDLVQHANSIKHQESSKAFLTSRSMTSFVQQSSFKTAAAEGALALSIIYRYYFVTFITLQDIVEL